MARPMIVIVVEGGLVTYILGPKTIDVTLLDMDAFQEDPERAVQTGPPEGPLTKIEPEYRKILRTAGVRI